MKIKAKIKTMQNIWDTRYAQEEYIYGKEANTFLKEQIALLPVGKALFPAEGEGRNAVYAAKKGWEVSAFDSSFEAKNKALKLALENKVQIKYDLVDWEDAQYKDNSFDLIVLIYAHPTNRQVKHQKLLSFLKPGGVILLEGFTKAQIKNTTGGPKSLDLLFSKEEIQADFAQLKEIKSWEESIFLSEGELHKGKASVIRMIGKKEQ